MVFNPRCIDPILSHNAHCAPFAVFRAMQCNAEGATKVDGQSLPQTSESTGNGYFHLILSYLLSGHPVINRIVFSLLCFIILPSLKTPIRCQAMPGINHRYYLANTLTTPSPPALMTHRPSWLQTTEHTPSPRISR